MSWGDNSPLMLLSTPSAFSLPNTQMQPSLPVHTHTHTHTHTHCAPLFLLTRLIKVTAGGGTTNFERWGLERRGELRRGRRCLSRAWDLLTDDYWGPLASIAHTAFHSPLISCFDLHPCSSHNTLANTAPPVILLSHKSIQYHLHKHTYTNIRKFIINNKVNGWKKWTQQLLHLVNSNSLTVQ